MMDGKWLLVASPRGSALGSAVGQSAGPPADMLGVRPAARIGVLVRRGRLRTDSIGAWVEAAAGRACAKAGLKAGDIITRFTAAVRVRPEENLRPGESDAGTRAGAGDTRRSSTAGQRCKRTKLVAEDVPRGWL